MAAKSWTILNVDENEYLDSDAQLGTKEFGVRKTTKRGGLGDGVDVLEVSAGSFAMRMVPTRGMGIWDATIQGERIGWQSPIRGPVHPHFVHLGEPSGLGWLDGFDELLVRCGLESNGAPEFDDRGQLLFPLHGRIANKPAHRVRVTIDDEQITVVGEVEETRFHFLKLRLVSTIQVRRGLHGFQLHDRVENISQSPSEIQMLYHANFGKPLLDAGSQVVVPAKKVVPRNARAAEGISAWNSYEAEQPGYEEQVYFLELLADSQGDSRALLRNAHGTRGVSLLFNTQQLPCFSIWKNTTAVPDGYVTGLEPGTNFPNPRSFEGNHQRVVQLAPGGHCEFSLAMHAHMSQQEVEQAEALVAEIQKSAEPLVLEAPQPDWCAP